MSTHPFLTRLADHRLTSARGAVTRLRASTLEADGPDAELGVLCRVAVEAGTGRDHVLAEIVGIGDGRVVLAPLEDARGVRPGACVEVAEIGAAAPLGDALAGRLVDAFGRPLDEGGPLVGAVWGALRREPISPLARTTPRVPLETGIRAVDGLITLGVGQRVGIFAAAGVGKTSLITQLARQVEADRCVVCLVGERGREIEAFWTEGLDAAERRRSVLVAAASHETAAARVRAAEYALALADHWRADGKHVLLVLDSATRLAMAMREIGLAAGEPPTVRGYTPSLFVLLPRLVEICGALRSGGAVTGLFTVLAESDETDDPLAEVLKSILDGHLVLSRRLAEQGHFPAIDAPRSVSRAPPALRSEAHRRAARTAVSWLSAYEEARPLIESGLYSPGADPRIDAALRRRPALLEFLRQDGLERTPFETTLATLQTLTEPERA